MLDCSSEVSYQGVEGEAGVEVFDSVIRVEGGRMMRRSPAYAETGTLRRSLSIPPTT